MLPVTLKGVEINMTLDSCQIEGDCNNTPQRVTRISLKPQGKRSYPSLINQFHSPTQRSSSRLPFHCQANTMCTKCSPEGH